MTPDEFASFLEGNDDARAQAPDGDGPPARLRAALAAPETWQDPPADLLQSILAGIEREQGDVVPISRARRSPAPAVLRWTAGLAAAAAVTVFAVLIARPPTGTEIALVATSRAPAATATARVQDTDTGLAITLDVRGLPPAPVGFYYQAWMKGPRGAVTIGTFHDRGGDGEVELWSGVSLADYPMLTVTLEPEDGDPASSGVVVLKSP